MTNIHVGVCAFKKKYYKSEINCVEVQQTFYNIPMERTLQKWKEEAPPDFIFNIKAFQGLTHDAKSPTWKRYTKKLNEHQKKLVGNLKLNELTKEWVNKYVNFMRVLNGRVLVIQTPASFNPTSENVTNALRFFEYLTEKIGESRADFWIGWEPRGKWLEDYANLENVFSSFDNLTHVVDIFFHEPVVLRRVVYFRLHGKPYLNYGYKYSEEDLKFLIQKIDDLKKASDVIFLMFNNVYMEQDTLKLKKLLGVK